ISPGKTSKSTCSSAWTPGKRLEIFSIFSKGACSIRFNLNPQCESEKTPKKVCLDLRAQFFSEFFRLYYIEVVSLLQEEGDHRATTGKHCPYCEGMPMEFKYSLYRSNVSARMTSIPVFSRKLSSPSRQGSKSASASSCPRMEAAYMT